MTPELSDRLAKLLRLACSNGPDGEKLAAINRLGAIAVAHDVDWDRALNGHDISRDDMQRIFNAGYERGVADTRQELRPERDWTPADGTSAEIGDDAGRLRAILNAAWEARANALLSDWEETFLGDMAARFERYGTRMNVSEKQWKVLDRLETKFRRAGIL